MVSPAASPASAAGPPDSTCATLARGRVGDADAEVRLGSDRHRAALVTRLDLVDHCHGVVDGDGVAVPGQRRHAGRHPAVAIGRRRGVDADDLIFVVEQRASGVARHHRGVGLDESSQILRATERPVALACGDRLVFGNDLAGHRRQEALAFRVPDGGDGVVGRDAVVVELGGREILGAVELEEGDVRGLVVPDNFGVIGVPGCRDGDLDRRGVLDDVVVRQHQAVRGEHHAGSRALAGGGHRVHEYDALGLLVGGVGCRSTGSRGR